MLVIFIIKELNGVKMTAHHLVKGVNVWAGVTAGVKIISSILLVDQLQRLSHCHPCLNGLGGG